MEGSGQPCSIWGFCPVSTQKLAIDRKLYLRREQNLIIMYSSEDLERFYFQYQTEALPHGESLQAFCVRNNVPYNIFQKWYKYSRKKVVEVQIYSTKSFKKQYG